MARLYHRLADSTAVEPFLGFVVTSEAQEQIMGSRLYQER
jgi:hypothetical protein